MSALKPSPDAYATNLSLLETAHSIFNRWRSEMRSDELFTVINFVLSQFVDPFLQVLRFTAGLLLDSPLPPKEDAETLAQCMVVLINLYYDLACQDLPPLWRIITPNFLLGTMDCSFVSSLGIPQSCKPMKMIRYLANPPR